MYNSNLDSAVLHKNITCIHSVCPVRDVSCYSNKSVSQVVGRQCLTVRT